MRIGFLCSGQGRVFTKVCAACGDILDSKVAVCIMDRECKSENTAVRYGIPAFFVMRKEYKSRAKFSDEVLRILKDHGVELVCLTFDSLLSGEIIEHYKNKMINIHPSLLPAFRGPDAAKRTFHSQAKFGGVSLHIVDHSMDTGPVIAQGIISIWPTMVFWQYGDYILHRSQRLMIQGIKWFEENRIFINTADAYAYVHGANYTSYPFCPEIEYGK